MKQKKNLRLTTQSHWDIGTTAGENEHDEEDSLKNYEPDVTNAERAIVPGIHEAKNVDDPKNCAKTREKDLTAPDRKTLYEFQDDVIVNDPVLSHGLDNIRRGKDHEEACGQQRSDGFINTDDIFIQSKYMMAEITETKEKPIAGTTQTHWDVVTPTGENKHGGEDSLENHETDETNAVQVIVPDSYEAKNVDDPKNGAKALVKDLTIPYREVLHKFQDDIILKDQVVPHKKRKSP